MREAIAVFTRDDERLKLCPPVRSCRDVFASGQDAIRVSTTLLVAPYAEAPFIGLASEDVDECARSIQVCSGRVLNLAGS